QPHPGHRRQLQQPLRHPAEPRLHRHLGHAPEWGLSVHDRALGRRLAERAAGVLDDHAASVADVHDRQDFLWKITRTNLDDLREILA
ncbi:hypothetical protein, partial [Streptomyces sp. NPDC000405]|uniref:hypothetical protein n=1 Tax=Streptomyces sp. NPDC000405 TaxID=3161033 RepID=UPI00398D31AB